jgi:Ca2+-binding RTX toxin-like protein
LIRRDGISGAGLNISFEGVELAEVDGLEGDDTFYVLSTDAKMAVTIIGGNGSDTVNVGGDVTDKVVALEVEGTSGFVNHAVLSDDLDFDEIFVDGIQLNVATASNGLVEIDDSGLSVLNEGGTIIGYYDVTLTSAITTTAFLTVSAARSSTADRQGKTKAGEDLAKSLLVSASETSGFASANVLTFNPGLAGQTQRVYVKAPNDGSYEGTTTVVISHAILSDTARDAGNKIRNVEVTVYDDDAAALLVEGNPWEIDIVEGGAAQTLSLRLSREPAAGEIVTITPSLAKEGDFVTDKASITFTHLNWDDIQTITVTAFDDLIEENREREPILLQVSSNAPTSDYHLLAEDIEIDVRIIDNDKGSVIVTESGSGTIVSETNPDTYTLSLSKEPTKDVVVSILSDGQTIASSDDLRWNAEDKTITFKAAIAGVPFDWTPAEIILSVGTVVEEDQPTVKPGAQNQLIADIAGPLFVFGGVGPGADRSLNVAVTLPTELDADLPQVSNPVDEDLQTDRLVVFNAGSDAEQSGLLTETNLTGFDMGPLPLVLDFGTANAPDIKTFDAGITYAEFEIFELLLGSNKDTLDIDSTAAGLITVIHGGGGDDKITLTGVGDAGGADRVLAIFGDTTQDGARYSSKTDAVGGPNGTGRAFAASGEDIIDASKATGGVMIYGGSFNDTITGSDFNDHLLGGSGDDKIYSLSGRDHVYGDNGLRIDLSVRNNLQPQLISIITSQAPAASDYYAQTGDALAAAGSDTITSTTGSSIIISDFGVIEQMVGVNRAFDTNNVTVVVSVRDAEGAIDNITGGSGGDWILAGLGADIIEGGDGDNVIFGDNGKLEVFGGVHRLVAQSGLVVPTLGVGDQIDSGSGFDWIIGAAGADTITDRSGGSVIIGDMGMITNNDSQQLINVMTRESEIGAGDILQSGDGNSIIFGGNGADRITTAGGDDVILGDMGTLDLVAGIRSVLNGPIEDPAHGGIDTIITGTGEDWVIGGEEGDFFTNTSGVSIFLGDAGRIEGDANGLFVRVETLQPTVGGNDKFTGGSDRDVQFGGAGEDYLEGNDGGDFLLGDGGLLTRLLIQPPSGFQLTLESTDITEGGDDSIFGGEGLDVVLGGIGNDLLSFVFKDDIAAGEFARVRFDIQPDGSEKLSSFLTPAVRDLDIIVQAFLGVSTEVARSTIVNVQDVQFFSLGSAPLADLTMRPELRGDVIFVASGLTGSIMVSGSSEGDDGVPAVGLFGYEMLGEPELLRLLPEIQRLFQGEGEGEVPAETEGTTPEGEVVEEAALTLPMGPPFVSSSDVTLGEPGQTASANGWRMNGTGWRMTASRG